MQVNPQVKSARTQWNSAVHQIKQNYVPADPTFGFNNIDSWRGISVLSLHEIAVSQALQFPGKALYQGDMAKRAAYIALRNQLRATLRDTRAAAETGYYQALLDAALADVTAMQVVDLGRVLKVDPGQLRNQSGRSDRRDQRPSSTIPPPRQTLAQNRWLACCNDLRQLNQLLFRRPDSPLQLAHKVELKPLTASADDTA